MLSSFATINESEGPFSSNTARTVFIIEPENSVLAGNDFATTLSF